VTVIELAALKPAMTEAEATLLRAAAAGRRSAIEFGCGGSTALLLEAGVGKLLAADTDAGWLQRVAGEPRCAKALASQRLRLLHIDLGPVSAWGWPQDAALLPRWPSYWRDPWEAAPDADFVFVDGRFRVACALNSLPRLAAEGVILIHDFWDRAAYQGPLLRHCEVLGSVARLAMLAPRRPLDAALLAADLAAHAQDPR
jgi:hypothetical protein